MAKSMMVDTDDIHHTEGALRRGEGRGTDGHLFNVHLKNNYQ